MRLNGLVKASEMENVQRLDHKEENQEQSEALLQPTSTYSCVCSEHRLCPRLCLHLPELPISPLPPSSTMLFKYFFYMPTLRIF